MTHPGWTQIAWLAAAGGIAAAALVARGCGAESNSAVPPVSEPDGADASDAAFEAGLDSTSPDSNDASAPADADAQATCAPQPIPPDVPQGWVEYPVMDCKYRLYVPPSRDLLPPPLAWEACTQDLGPDSYNCRQIKVDWPTDIKPPYAIGGEAPAYVDADGKVVMQLAKTYRREGTSGRETAFMSIVVEADGPVRQAFWNNYQTGQIPPLWLTQRGVAPGKSSWVISEWSGGTSIRDVSVGGDDTLLSPPVLLDVLDSSPDVATVVAGSDYYVETGYNFRVRAWDGADMGLAAQGAGAYSPPTWVGPTLLFALESFPAYRVRRWTAQDGAQELVGFGSDMTKGAGDPGSDGKDLVWIQGESLGPNDTDFPVKSIMTSPFSTDPSKIQPRRLRRWDVQSIGTGSMAPAVGCGRAAFPYPLNTGNPRDSGLLVVRLSDGVSWLLPNPASVGGGWGWPIALTCDEVFSMYQGQGGMTVLRVRLDSLGPGTPPDP